VKIGYTGAGCPVQGYRIHADGVDLPVETDGCSPTGSLWVSSGSDYTAVLTVAAESLLDVSGVGSLTGTSVYSGAFNTLFVGNPGGAASDPGRCWGSIDQIIVEPLGD